MLPNDRNFGRIENKNLTKLPKNAGKIGTRLFQFGFGRISAKGDEISLGKKNTKLYLFLRTHCQPCDSTSTKSANIVK
jgi:hypothetical protein